MKNSFVRNIQLKINRKGKKTVRYLSPRKLSFFILAEANKSSNFGVSYDIKVFYANGYSNHAKQLTLNDLDYFKKAFIQEWL